MDNSKVDEKKSADFLKAMLNGLEAATAFTPRPRKPAGRPRTLSADDRLWFRNEVEHLMETEGVKRFAAAKMVTRNLLAQLPEWIGLPKVTRDKHVDRLARNWLRCLDYRSGKSLGELFRDL